MTKDPNILSYEEMAKVLHDKMMELVDVNRNLLSLQRKHNNTLTALLAIKSSYPHIFEECITEDTINKICGKE